MNKPAISEKILEDVGLFVLDMDGTVYLGDHLIPGSLDFIHDVQKSGRDYIFFTNNASRIPEYYVEKLKKMGLVVTEDKIMTAGDVTIAYIQTYYPQARVYLNGTPLLEQSFRNHGIRLVEDQPDVAIQSFDTTLTYDKLDKICRFVREGVPFIATHMDTNCPTEDGFMPDCGAMCALITESTGIAPRFLGKPWEETMEMVLELTGYKRDAIAFVGDRIYTDVATGVNNGAKGFLVLTGESDLQTVRTSDVVPTCIFDSLDEMRKYL
ncbi:Haloacid Dehalogenase Superfamily Class (subfamily) IIA [Eubacterium aggregans]|uniref:Haloacid Dehalogenase Superfamily Class (Subfamily) IIA n=1 Tax=Eubacterium aggregans TaxID=81409 RepID=A0A1H3WSC0_9FIRM|nr:HAD-IIA family hydrolase [Eubacterium aggregans]SDZ89088.1 Haloacid Dehalogenase Superfamily Class (subfamily) IIA [Eubacterium aggregans]